jgi:hypothetical protein
MAGAIRIRSRPEHWTRAKQNRLLLRARYASRKAVEWIRLTRSISVVTSPVAMDPLLLRVKSEASIANSSGPAMHAGVAGFRARLEDSDKIMISEKHEDGYGKGDDTSSLKSNF